MRILIYSGNYTSLTREMLMEKVASKLSDNRFQHVLRVEKKAIELAGIYDVDIEKASIAALSHDYAKERPDDEMISLINSQGFDKELSEFGNAIWHGILGSYLAKKELDITDCEILQAIELHTTGAQIMSELDKVIYVADYIEDGRDFPVVEEARKLAKIDLNMAVGFETKQTLLYLINNQNKIYPKTLETYNKWVVK